MHIYPSHYSTQTVSKAANNNRPNAIHIPIFSIFSVNIFAINTYQLYV